MVAFRGALTFETQMGLIDACLARGVGQLQLEHGACWMNHIHSPYFGLVLLMLSGLL